MSPRTHIELVKSRGWLLLLLLTMSMGRMSAAVVDDAVARAVASDFMQSQIGKPLLSDGGNLQLVYTEPSIALPGAADYYVFNGVDGFLIVAGDDRSDVVLGYGEGALDLNNLPCGMQWLLDEYRTRMEWLHTHPEVDIKKSEASPSSVVEPLLTCRWGQQDPFRDQCPTINGKHCNTGCVATAMAQVMYYWKHPSKAPELDGYRTTTEKIEVAALPSVPLAWDDMLDRYSSGTYSESQGAAVATLMRYCGQSCKTDYGIASSSAWIVDQLAGMKKFGYDPNASLVDRLDYNEEEWRSMMLEDLYDGYPIICSGSGPAGSHNFVVDGYDGSKFHINWGWYGSSDGYFALDGFLDYNNSRQMLHRLCPDESRFGYNFMKDGVYYKKIGEDSVMVVCNKETGNTYSGSVFIPDTVYFGGLPYLVTQIGDQAFMGCTGLTSVRLPDSLSSIGTQAFMGCTGLTCLRLPNELNRIEDKAFAGCGSFERLDLPDLESWMAIDIQGSESNPMAYARKIYFDGIEMSHEFEFPDGITRIPANAFRNCNIITSVSFPSSIVKIGADAFADCKSLKKIVIQNLAAWCRIDFENYGSNPMSNSLSSSMWDMEEIAVYNDGHPVTQLEIPEGITTISDFAFIGAPFENVTFPSSLVSIGANAFSCVPIRQVIFPSNLISIGAYAFSHVPLVNVEFPPNLTTIGEGAFTECALVELTLPEGLVELGKEAFCNCCYLEKVHIGAGLEVIPECVFLFCFRLSEVYLPPTVKQIRRRAFAFCGNLTTMPIIDSVEVIEASAFSDSGISYLKTGNTLTTIGDYAFSSCVDLTEVVLDNQVTSLGTEAFSDDYSLQTLVVGDGVHVIPKSLCSYCDDLKSVTLGKRVDTVEQGAFKGCSLISTITCKAKVPPIMSGSNSSNSYFHSSVFNNATLYVPRRSLDAYRSAPIWKNFQNIVGVDMVIIPGDVNDDEEVNVADVNALIDTILSGGYQEDMDLNSDGEVNVADVNALIDLILKG